MTGLLNRMVIVLTAVAVSCALSVNGTAYAQGYDLTPLVPEIDESGFGILLNSMSSPYVGGGFNGIIDSRVYVDQYPGASSVTFVWDLQVALALSAVSDLSIASTGTQNDLRVYEIINGVNGYISSTTTNIPDDAVLGMNNPFPIVDELVYSWSALNEMGSSDRATLYATTTGAVDVGVISAAIQDGSVAYAEVFAPVDDPTSPDLNIPEPASMVVFTVGGLMLFRRRR